MHGHHSWLALGVCLAVSVAGWAQPPRPRDGNLKVGALAPDFTVKDVDGKKTVKLSALQKKPVVLIFGSCT